VKVFVKFDLKLIRPSVAWW